VVEAVWTAVAWSERANDDRETISLSDKNAAPRQEHSSVACEDVRTTAALARFAADY